MNLHDLSPPEGSKTKKERKGRGTGARRGETAGRGNKGQKKRNTIPVYFEGGQTPIYRRLPKFGFTPINRTEYQEVNVEQLNYFDEGDDVTPERLLEANIIDDVDRVKLLGGGELEVSSLSIEVHAVTSGAEEKVSDTDGTIDLLSDSGD